MSVPFKSQLRIDVNLTVLNSKLFKLIADNLMKFGPIKRQIVLQKIFDYLQTIDASMFLQYAQVNKTDFLEALARLLKVRLSLGN